MTVGGYLQRHPLIASLYQNKLRDVGVQGMLPGLYIAEELEELR